MISLRKHIDNHKAGAAGPPPSAVSLVDGVVGQSAAHDRSVAAFRSTLLAMGTCGQRAVPSVGEKLNSRLREIQDTLRIAPTPESLDQASEEVKAELSGWADSAVLQHNENEREIKEIMGVVARAAEAIVARDESCSREIGNLTTRMKTIAQMNDLAAIRTSILESTTLLKSCVEKMVEEGKASVRNLNAEVVDYRNRLEVSERAATLDPLTKLANRRAFEAQLERRIAFGGAFVLILLDLNDFKSVNDVNGHLAGDDLLRQFAAELRAQFSPADAVCRWGGDEFAVLISGGAKEASDRVDGITRWVLGEYKINCASGVIRLQVQASIGSSPWDGKETGLELIARVDQSMYRNKMTSKSEAGTHDRFASDRPRSRPVPV